MDASLASAVIAPLSSPLWGAVMALQLVVCVGIGVAATRRGGGDTARWTFAACAASVVPVVGPLALAVAAALRAARSGSPG
jgi:hypothetical protein